MRESRESDIRESKAKQPGRVVPIPKIDEFSFRA